MTRSLRTDAEDNRDRLLRSARRLFADRGLSVTMREVARHAEVGPATLYRRFPTRAALIDAAFADEVDACRRVVDAGGADPDPWRGLCAVLTGLGELNARNQGFVDAVVASVPDANALTSHRAGLLRKLADLVERARRAGSIRPDATVDDVILIVMAGRGLSAATPERRLAAARRFSVLAIDALRAPTAAPR